MFYTLPVFSCVRQPIYTMSNPFIHKHVILTSEARVSLLLMRAVTIEANGLIAIVAQHSIFLRETRLNDTGIMGVSARFVFFSVGTSCPVNVVYYQKLYVFFLAAGTKRNLTFAIMLENLQPFLLLIALAVFSRFACVRTLHSHSSFKNDNHPTDTSIIQRIAICNSPWYSKYTK